MSEVLLVALDHAGMGDVVADAASTLAARLGDSVVLLNVVQLPDGLDPGTVLHTGDSHEGHTALDVLTDDAHQALRRFATRFVDKGVPTRLEVRAGHPAPTIVECAEHLGASMIVMGTHGRTGLGRLVLGSVADRVIRTAPCPVVTLRLAGPDRRTTSQDQVIAESCDG